MNPPTSIAERVAREYAAEAARYDRRWARYLRGSMELLRPWLAAEPAGELLDVGCGTGALLEAMRGWGVEPARYVGADPSAEMLRMAAVKLRGDAALACAPSEALPFRDASFDTVVSASSFHYWPAPGEALREIRRVLRPGGRLVLADWSRDFATMRVLDAVVRLTGHAYVRTYARREIGALLDDAGFPVRRVRQAKIGPMWGLWVAEARGG